MANSNHAMIAACAAVEALGRCQRRAVELTADWYHPARQHLVKCWLMYAWASRDMPAMIPHWRNKLREAVAIARKEG